MSDVPPSRRLSVALLIAALAWSTVLVYLVVFWRHRIEVLHVVILPLVLVLLFVSDLLPQDHPVGDLVATWRAHLEKETSRP